jgi:hypothetical protein
MAGHNSLSTGVGLSAGTGFASLVSLLSDGGLKSLLLIVAPAVTIIISRLWHLIIVTIEQRIADVRLREQIEQAARVIQELKANPNASNKAKADAQKILDAMTLLKVQVAQKRARAIVA